MRFAVGLMMMSMAAALGGCYSYQRVPLTEIPPGADVRARVSADHADSLRSQIGQSRRVLEGVVVSASADQLLVSVPAMTSAESAIPLRQNVAVPRSAIFEVELRRLDKVKTGAVVAAAAAGAAILAYAAFDIGNGSPGGNKGGGELQIMLPRFFGF